MAKSDLLKEAIADAKAVKETALANAKIALQEAFLPRMKEMLSTKMEEELEDEEGDLAAAGADGGQAAGADDLAAGADELEAGADDLAGASGTDVGDLSIDVNNDGEFDEFDIMSREEMPGEDAAELSDEELEDEYNEGYMYEADDLNLESIIQELEHGLETDDMPSEEEEESVMKGDYSEEEEEPLEEDIDAIIEAILREEDMDKDSNEFVGVKAKGESGTAKTDAELAEAKEELEEAYKTVRQLKNIINEVNLLNAKLLYTNKLFRNFELNESQKMKVIENFDRAGNTREVKLVFSTLAESFTNPKTKKRVVKESYASKPVATTAPKTNTILNEGFELAERWKKLAGLL